MAHIRTRETYGTRRLQTELAENGIIVGRDRLARLRKELRLRCKQKRKFRATTNSNHNLPVAPNLLNQTFAPTAPNQVWVADLTYVATQEGWLYLAGIKDVYTCEIVGYAMGERMTKELTGKALFMALRSQRPPAGLIHHSDRGSQYCAYDYRVIQEQFGLKTSMSRKGNCYDNAPMESFWGTLKNESLSHYRFNNRDEAISVIREYIEIFYNRQRRHSRLGNISPAAFREKYHQMAVLKKEQMVVSAIASTPQILPGALKDKDVIVMSVNGDKVTEDGRILTDRGQRIRDVRTGPDGYLYVLTDESSGELLKVSPRN
ncbi:integrase core domain protein [Shigella dysenteriae 1617]|nr:integrase core domain protein [Shigella dysenteriae 1617]